jgi:hypothetical protein
LPPLRRQCGAAATVRAGLQPPNFLRTPTLPEAVKQWSSTTLRKRLVKIGGRIVRHGRSITSQMAEIIGHAWVVRTDPDRYRCTAATAAGPMLSDGVRRGREHAPGERCAQMGWPQAESPSFPAVGRPTGSYPAGRPFQACWERDWPIQYPKDGEIGRPIWEMSI